MRIKHIIDKLNSSIKDALEEQNIQQKQYAKKIQISESTFSNYVTGSREMPYEVLAQIADDFDLDLNYIFKTKSKKMVMLSSEEQAFYNTLKSLSDEERSEVYKSLNTLIGIRKK